MSLQQTYKHNSVFSWSMILTRNNIILQGLKNLELVLTQIKTVAVKVIAVWITH